MYGDYNMIFVETCIYYFCFYGGTMAAKLGQIFSARTDLFSGDLIKELSKLRDQCHVNTFNPTELDLNRLPKNVSDINYNALKAGTICIVLKCKYKNKPAIIKFVKKNVAKQLADTFYWMLLFLWMVSYFDPCNLYQRISELEKSFLQQTDLRKEAANQLFWYQKYNNKQVRVPKIFSYNEYAICMERIDEKRHLIVKLSAKEQYKHALALYTTVYDSLYISGKVHADLHPGNILFDGKQFYFIDYGWCIDIDAFQKKNNILLGIAFKNNDYEQLATVICSIYFPQTQLQRSLKRFLKKARLCEQQYTGVVLSDILSRFCIKYRLNLSPNGSATESAMINIDGMLPYLFPNIPVHKVRADSMKKLEKRIIRSQYNCHRS